MHLRLRATAVGILVLLAAPLAAEAQPAKKIPRVGYLTLGPVDKDWFAGFQRGLRELGYVEGESIVIERRYGAGRSERLADLTAELVRLHVDVLFVGGEAAALAAKKATGDIPIVMVTVADPVAIGLVASLAAPGGNVTGLSDSHADLVTKRLQLLKEVVPSASGLAVLVNPANPAHPFQVQSLRAAAPALGVKLLPLEVKARDDIERAFTTMRRARPGGLLVLGDRLIGNHRRRIIELALNGRVPTIFTHRSWVEGGGLMSYGANFPDQYRRAAIYVDKILKGAQPADLPVEQPTQFELIINRRTAKALGLTIPRPLLLQADQVIE